MLECFVFTHSVVIFLIRKNSQGVTEVCLGLKKRGYSEGKYNGFGGKIETGENPQEAAVRELKEESEVKVGVGLLNKKGIIKYFEPGENWLVHIFVCDKWAGKIRESDEMRPFWFDVSNLPLDKMWENDALWIKDILTTEQKIEGTIWHDKNDKVVKKELKLVDKFDR